MLKRTLAILCILLSYTVTYGYNLRQISNADGLSNSAILSLYQDRGGKLWFGTYDGLNMYDGISVTPFTLGESQNLEGNIIEGIIETEEGVLWALTNYGLSKIDQPRRLITNYSQPQGGYAIRKNEKEEIFVLFKDNTLHCITPQSKQLQKLQNQIVSEWYGILDIQIIQQQLYTFSDKGIQRYPLLFDETTQTYALGKVETLHPLSIAYAFSEEGISYLIDQEQTLYEYDIAHDCLTNIASLKDETFQRGGGIADIVKHGNSYFIAYKTNGILKLTPQDKEMQVEDLGIKSGIFRLQKDKYQNIIWIGTDGQGVYIYSEERYSIQSVTYQDLNVNIGKPVRSIFIDKENTLWLGTKGEGVLKVYNYDINKKKIDYHTELVTTHNSQLCDNSVFAFAASRRPLFWIGTDEGLNYYSYAEKRIKKIDCPESIIYIHDLYEENDSTLWMATVGTGIIKAHIGGRPDAPRLTHLTRYTIDNANRSSNYFFTLCPDKQGNYLFGNRGYGVFRLENEQLVSMPMKHQYTNKTVNDIFSIVRTDSTLWLGNSYGLIKQQGDNEWCFSRDNGFIDSAVHNILKDDQNGLWISTNCGLVHFHRTDHTYQIYNLQNGLKILEFSDGAALRTDKGFLFGGINGIAVISEDTTLPPSSEYMPPVRFTRLNVLGKSEDLHKYITYHNEVPTLSLSYDQNFFSVYFVATDYIHSNNYAYLYKIDKASQWIDNGNTHSLSFTQLAPGDYTLYIKYRNQTNGKESPVYSMHIHIQPPWYLSRIAIWGYQLLFLLLIAWIVRTWIVRQRRKQAQTVALLEQAHREEVYEEKLRFFTNITHEFCTPLTLIYGPCERILAHTNTDDYIRKYVHQIKWNAERLNTLIQEVIDFRRMETGHKERNIQPTCVSHTCQTIVASFAELAEQNSIQLETDIEPQLYWNTDENCLTKIINNLVSNAFKYTPNGGHIRICLQAQDQQLHFSVYNTGKGIRPEDMQRIFNRYSVLDNVEENAVKGLSSRNGLGMAICQSMTTLLDGNIRIESEAGQYARFIVSLPALEITDNAITTPNAATADVTQQPLSHSSDTPSEVSLPSTGEPATQADKKHILVIDDNIDILTLLQEALSDLYQVTTASTGEEGLERLKKEVPDLIITDVMMPGTDGIELTRQIKGNRHTMHIPLIILSARAGNEDKTEGMESGADAYIEKPFSINYLKATVRRLITTRLQMKEYYNSSACAYDFADGQLMQKEDKEFLQSLRDLIDQHIDSDDLSPDYLAEHLQVSTRHLYRKLHELNQLPPNDFIKQQRIAFAAKLLRTTTLTIQEIIYQSGFSNRAHFYKEFAKYYQATPKEYRTQNRQKDDSLN